MLKIILYAVFEEGYITYNLSRIPRNIFNFRCLCFFVVKGEIGFDQKFVAHLPYSPIHQLWLQS